MDITQGLDDELFYIAEDGKIRCFGEFYKDISDEDYWVNRFTTSLVVSNSELNIDGINPYGPTFTRPHAGSLAFVFHGDSTVDTSNWNKNSKKEVIDNSTIKYAVAGISYRATITIDGNDIIIEPGASVQLPTGTVTKIVIEQVKPLVEAFVFSEPFCGFYTTMEESCIKRVLYVTVLIVILLFVVYLFYRVSSKNRWLYQDLGSHSSSNNNTYISHR